jgi:hypothetical protein
MISFAKNPSTLSLRIDTLADFTDNRAAKMSWV